MKSHLFWGLCASMAIVGCRSRDLNSGSSLRETVSTMGLGSGIGISNYAVMHTDYKNYKTFDFYHFNFDNNVIDKTKTAAGDGISHKFKISQGWSPRQGVNVDLGNGTTVFLSESNNANYEYWTPDDQVGEFWNCEDAMFFLTNEKNKGDPSHKCFVGLDTEDRQWFGVTVIDRGASGSELLSYTPSQEASDLTKKLNSNQIDRPMFDASTGTKVAQTLLPGRHINVGISADDETSILNVMNAWNAKHQQSHNANKERQSCLRNGRAAGWGDLQAHFYCILPYAPYRQCYSTSLVTLTSNMASITDPKEQVKTLLGAFEQSFQACFSSTSGAVDKFTDEEAAVFRYIMFTKSGLMDFNIDRQNEVINAFYKGINTERPRRLTDTLPYTDNQPRYDLLRKKQAPIVQGK